MAAMRVRQLANSLVALAAVSVVQTLYLLRQEEPAGFNVGTLLLVLGVCALGLLGFKNRTWFNARLFVCLLVCVSFTFLRWLNVVRVWTFCDRTRRVKNGTVLPVRMDQWYWFQVLLLIAAVTLPLVAAFHAIHIVRESHEKSHEDSELATLTKARPPGRRAHSGSTDASPLTRSV